MAKRILLLLVLLAPLAMGVWWYEFHRYDYRRFCAFNAPEAYRENYCRTTGKCKAAPYNISVQRLYDEHCWGYLRGWPNRVE